MPWWVILILRIILGIVLGLVIAGTGLFGYIAWKAKARKWSGGMFAVLALAVFLFYWLVLGNPWGVIPL